MMRAQRWISKSLAFLSLTFLLTFSSNPALFSAQPNQESKAAKTEKGVVQRSSQAGLEEILHGLWGSGSAQIGLKLLEPGALPAAPFHGPGGFRPAADGRIWISDSVNHRLIGFGTGQPLIIPVPARVLGDLEISGDKAFICTLDPNGVGVIDLKSGKQLNHVAIPFKSPNRLFVCAEDRFSVSETQGGLWVVISGKPSLHPAQALEPIGNKDLLFGTLFDFDPSSRKIIKAGWNGENDEPALFALFNLPGQRIVFSRLYGMHHDSPVLGIVSASSPERLQFITFDNNGKASPFAEVPLLDGPPLPFPWVIGSDGYLYGMSGDLEGFRLHRCKISN